MSREENSFEGSVVAQLSLLMTDARSGTGTVTALRRFDPVGRPADAAFEVCMLLDRVGISAEPGTNAFASWSVIIHCLALVRGSHSRGIDVGRALVDAGISEARVRQLLESDRPMLFDLLPRIARRFASSSQPADWLPLARLALNVGVNEQVSQEARLDIAYRFQRALAKAA